MKKLLLIMSLFLIIVSVASSQSFDIKKLSVYGGAGLISTSVTDFVDFHISDWENYGLEGSEGRVLVPLKENEPGSSFKILIGANYDIIDNLKGVLEINYAVSGLTVQQLLIGIDYTFFQTGNLKFGIVPKAGYTVASADFGAIELLPDKTPPVILPEGTFREGDDLKMELNGINVQVGVNVSYSIMKMIDVFANINYGLSFGSEGKLSASGTEIPFSANGVVKDDWTSTQADIEPNVNIQGIGIGIGVVYHF